MAALTLLRPHLDSENMQVMYIMFIRSITEYGSVVYMSASETALAKLDRIQARAELIGQFKAPSLAFRRESAALSFAFKLMDGSARGALRNFVPQLEQPKPSQLANRRNTTGSSGIQIRTYTNQVPRHFSLNTYERGFWGALPKIWSELPQILIQKGYSRCWKSIGSKCKIVVLNEYKSDLDSRSRA